MSAGFKFYVAVVGYSPILDFEVAVKSICLYVKHIVVRPSLQLTVALYRCIVLSSHPLQQVKVIFKYLLTRSITYLQPVCHEQVPFGHILAKFLRNFSENYCLMMNLKTAKHYRL